MPIGGTWHAKTTGGYSRDSQEALDNVHQIGIILNEQGWAVEAMAAFLGNGAGESGLNPWRWESDDIPTVQQFNDSYGSSTSHGYGLVQFTPPNKYINATNSELSGYGPNFADSPGKASDGNSQILFLNNHIPQDWSGGLYDYYADDFDAIGVDISTFYYMTFEEFKAGNGTLSELTGAFCLKYERPADWAAASSYNTRVSNAEYWLEILKTLGFFSLHPWMVQRRLASGATVVRRKRIFRR